MILCKYSKSGGSIYVPHLDILREMGRAVRRADLQIAYSEGYNPHMLLYFSQPLPLGLKSRCEYFCAVSDELPSAFAAGLNAKLPPGIRITGAVGCESANVHSQTRYAAYRFFSASAGIEKGVLDNIMSRTTIEIPLKTKKGINCTDVRNRIYSLKEESGTALGVLSCGKDDNLRADAFAAFLAAETGLEDIDVIKEDAFALKDGELITIDRLYGLKEAAVT